jgi:anti-anti-sigma factor
MTLERDRVASADVVRLDTRRYEPPDFAIAPRREGRCLVLAVRGELDLATGPELEWVCGVELMNAGAIDAVRIDFGGVSFVDVAGVRTVRRCAELAAGYGAACQVSGYGAQAHRVFTLCGAAELLDAS